MYSSGDISLNPIALTMVARRSPISALALVATLTTLDEIEAKIDNELLPILDAVIGLLEGCKQEFK